MSRGTRPTTSLLGAILSVLVVGVTAPVAAAETSTSDRFEVIVSDPVAAGAAPEFEVVETDLGGLVDLVRTVEPGERIELNRAAELTWTPTDPDYIRQWGHQLAGLDRAWDVTRGSREVVIAVLDTGVAPVAELGDRVLPGISMVEADPHDDVLGHGTSVALVAAAAHDGQGVAGVCPECTILPVQVANEQGSVPWAGAADGIVWAVDHGADIINLSFGGAGAPAVVEEAVDYALASGVVVVAAAGNDGHEEQFFPAAYDGVIAVAGHDPQFGRYGWSNFGPWVDVTAPGCTAEPPTTRCGTSYAAPWVTGLVGLVQAAHGEVDPATAAAVLGGASNPLSWVADGWVDAGTALAGQFVDVTPDAYYAEPVAWMVENGITNGTSAHTYSPEAPVTRAQLATFLWRLAGAPAATAPAAFGDVTTDAYYAEPVAWMVADGITTGTGPGTYSPDAPVTRAQLATFLWRYAGQPGSIAGAMDAGFGDVATGAYYAEPVAWMVADGITTGTGPATYSPDAPVTRAQLATFLWRFSA